MGDVHYAESGGKPLYMSAFKTSGDAEIMKTGLGVHPSPPMLVNGAELLWKVIGYQSGRWRDFECRQITWDACWQLLPARGSRKAGWWKVSETSQTPDDPDPGLQATAEPLIGFIDTPGFTTSGRELTVGKGVKTSPEATAVQLKQNFTAWVMAVEKETGAKDWVSADFEWHSVQSLTWAGNAWKAAAGTEIAAGHVSLGDPSQTAPGPSSP